MMFHYLSLFVSHYCPFSCPQLLFLFHSVENYEFFCHSDFTWNQFWRIQKFKKCLFFNFRGSENATIDKKSNLRGSKCVEMALFGLLKCLKLISQKIWVEENPEISTLCLRISLPIRFYVESSNSKPLK